MNDEVKEVENEDLDFGESICANIANLSAALSNLDEIDMMLKSPEEKQKLDWMKRVIFDSLYFNCEILNAYEPEK